MKETIYIAEDEESIRQTVKAFLESEGYAVAGYENGDLLYDAFLREPCDLVILDVMMPGSSGFDITRKIRAISTVPIIILTARDSDIDYATGINLGSDDYFTKPFSAMSLVMRVKAMLRRVRLDRQQQDAGPGRPAQEIRGGIAEKAPEKLSFGSITINRNTMTVLSGNDPIDLTPSEFNLLVYLAEHPDRVISRDELLDRIWGIGKEIETRACDDTVRRLRKKIAGTTVRIETVWGFGFILKTG